MYAFPFRMSYPCLPCLSSFPLPSSTPSFCPFSFLRAFPFPLPFFLFSPFLLPSALLLPLLLHSVPCPLPAHFLFSYFPPSPTLPLPQVTQRWYTTHRSGLISTPKPAKTVLWPAKNLGLKLLKFSLNRASVILSGTTCQTMYHLLSHNS